MDQQKQLFKIDFRKHGIQSSMNMWSNGFIRGQASGPLQHADYFVFVRNSTWFIIIFIRGFLLFEKRNLMLPPTRNFELYFYSLFSSFSRACKRKQLKKVVQDRRKRLLSSHLTFSLIFQLNNKKYLKQALVVKFYC